MTKSIQACVGRFTDMLRDEGSEKVLEQFVRVVASRSLLFPRDVIIAYRDAKELCVSNGSIPQNIGLDPNFHFNSK
ncbi:hypothetical protein COB55_01645 [Candidatus Wolfebacteria bacterium]|nr:MAG: hypothetical protein COB55_01645 [Candidatus Wolfebacteria bacterium]